MPLRAVAALFGAALPIAACTGGSPEAEQDARLRVGTSHGVGEFTPSGRMGGAAFNLRELAYEPATAYGTVDTVRGRDVVFAPKGPAEAALLAEHLAFEGLVGAKLSSEGEVVARFSSREAAEEAYGAFEAGQPAVATGPFGIDTGDGVVHLRSREEGSAIDHIEVRSLPTTELWRRLLGRDLDVIPELDFRHRPQFEGMHSVRTVDRPVMSHQSLIFNTDHPDLAAPSVRRRLAGELDRDAIARVACGGAGCEGPDWVDRELGVPDAGARNALLPAAIDIAVLETDSSLLLAAEVIRQQLRSAGVEVRIEALALDELLSPALDQFSAWLAPLPSAGFEAVNYLVLYGVLSLEESRLEAGRAGRDEEIWRRVFREELPAVPLYESRYFAAIDARFCGGEPDRISKWSWLADLHLCKVASR